MQFFKTILILLIVTYIYVYLASTGVVAYANIAIMLMAFTLTADNTLYVFNRLWIFLYENSFCPWLMIFNKRQNSVIIFEASQYLEQCGSADTFYKSFEAFIEAIVCICEMFVGPVIGFILAFLQIVVSYKSGVLCFSKLINRK